MKFSEAKIKTLRSTNEPSKNADLLIRAGYINQLAAGIYTYLPLGKRVLDNINQIIREEMDAIGGQEITMPALQPAENWQKTGRWDSLDVLFKFKSFYTKTDYALGSTHEEVVAPLAKSYISSYKDLPLYLYQIQTKFRDEKRAKSGLLRNREFPMKDLYSFHADESDLDKYYDKVAKAYKKIYKRCGIGSETYYTYASGGSFAKYSHEFQTLCEAGEDIIYVCEKCKIAINREIIKDIKHCPECGSANLVEQKAIEVGNIFKLGTKYSKPFELNYRDKNDHEQDVIMGCYGIGPGRVMGTIVEKIADGRGLVWPKEIAPFRVHLVTLDGKNKESQEVYDLLEKEGLSVLWDDRDETTGVKLADADLLGMPVRVIVSAKTLTEKKIEIKPRDKKNFELVNKSELVKKIKNA
jgi:prolyl-tRNA synthetase